MKIRATQKSFLAFLLFASACGGGGGSTDSPVSTSTPRPASSPTPTATPISSQNETRCRVTSGTDVNFDVTDRACERLSSYRFFRTPQVLQAPNDGVTPYDLNTPLFSDYTTKHRFVFLPEGASATYDQQESFEFPVGTVIIKTFAYPLDRRVPVGGEHVIETRLLIHRAEGWEGLPYVWSADGTDAVQRTIGATVQLNGIEPDGTIGVHEYNVPNSNQCKECHRVHGQGIEPIGPKARHLNRKFLYVDGEANQIERWTALGILSGAPADPNAAPRSPVFDDPSTGTLVERARAYLDANCSHCHNPEGTARPTAVYFNPQNTDPYHLGICKSPTAAGNASGNFTHVIEPGDPETSILVRRIRSTEPDIAMPEVGRRRVHEEGVELLVDWIASLSPGCPE